MKTIQDSNGDGSAPSHVRPTVPDVLPIMYAYRDVKGNESGGSLHVVLDDGNTEDAHVNFCIRYAKDQGDAAGVQLGEMLLKMSPAQRKKLSDMFYSSYTSPACTDESAVRLQIPESYEAYLMLSDEHKNKLREIVTKHIHP